MLLKTVIRQGEYFDSVRLMIVSKTLSELSGIIEAAVQMGTELNKEMLKRTGLLDEISANASADDMMISIRGENTEVVAAALEQIDVLLNQRGGGFGEEYRPKTIDSALKAMSGLNLAIISVPGRYAKAEAMKVLQHGMHVMLFSDNVTLEEEAELKEYSVAHGLMVMGPDCGTAVLNNIPLGFANKVRKGNIGMVGAAGTGMQEVMMLIHKYGGGVSQAIGTGDRDLSATIGGATMLQGLRALNADPATEIIVVLSKPPAPEIIDKVLKCIKEECKKPTVVNFIGSNISKYIEISGAIATDTLEATAQQAVKLAGIKTSFENQLDADSDNIAKREASQFAVGQKYLRGLYSGGTLCYESMLILKDYAGDIFSNTPLNKEMILVDSNRPVRNTCLDMGEDEFTAGRAHPMIDTALREKILEASVNDPQVAIILLDIVIGSGVHSDPAQVFADLAKKYKEQAAKQGRHLVILSSICGTDEDPQNALLQQKKLQKAGVIVMPCNASAARLAGKILSLIQG